MLAGMPEPGQYPYYWKYDARDTTILAYIDRWPGMKMEGLKSYCPKIASRKVNSGRTVMTIWLDYFTRPL